MSISIYTPDNDTFGAILLLSLVPRCAIPSTRQQERQDCEEANAHRKTAQPSEKSLLIGSVASGGQQPQPRFTCAFEGCSSSTSRAFDLERHYNTVHHRMLLDCPDPGCLSLQPRLDALVRHLRLVHKWSDEQISPHKPPAKRGQKRKGDSS